MPNIISIALGFVLLTWTLYSAGRAVAQNFKTESSASQTLELLMDQAPLSDVVEAIAERTGNDYLFESPLPGRVTIAVPSRVSASEATEILNAALQLKGMVAIPLAEGRYKIVRWEKMAGSAPYTEAPLRSDAERAITTRFALRYADSELVAQTLRPLLQANAQIIAYPPANSLIFAGTENRIHRLIELARLIDTSHKDALVVLRLRYRDASEVKSQLDALLRTDSKGAERSSTVSVRIDERTNALLLTAPKTELAKLREWIQRIDIPMASTGELHVIHLIYRDPVEITNILRGLATGGAAAANTGAAVANTGPLVDQDYTVVAHPSTRSLVIRSDREVFNTLRQLISKLDLEPRMVRVDVKIIEISTNGSLGLGVGAAIPFIEPTPKKIYGILINPELLPVEIPGVISVPGVLGAPLIQISGSDSTPGLGISVIAREIQVETKLLQEPSIIVEVGKEAELFVGDNIPIPVAATPTSNLVTPETAGSDATPLPNFGFGPTLRTNIDRQDVGLLIRFKPTLSGDDSLQLELHLENRLVIGIGDPATGPILANRVVDTSFTAGYGKRMIIAGLNSETTSRRGQGVPFLSATPILGQATSASLSLNRKTYMLVSIEAQLLPTSEEKQASQLALARAVAELDIDLEQQPGAMYAVRAGSYYVREVAKAAEQLLLPEVEPWRMRITQRKSDGDERFDLFVVGLTTIADVASVSLALEQAGMTPEIVPLARDSAKSP